MKKNFKGNLLVKLLALIFLSAVIFFNVIGCDSEESAADNGEPAASVSSDIPILTIGTTMTVENTNIDDYYFNILRGVFSNPGLISLDEEGGFIDALASRWETNDNRVWTFYLKENLTWHDGEPVTAEDIVFTIEYLLEHLPVMTFHWGMIESVEDPEPEKVIITLKEPNSRFLVNLMVLRTIPAHIFADIDDPLNFVAKEAAMGCGPYRFESYNEAAGLLVYKAFEDYHEGTPVVPEVHVRLFKNPDTMYMALKKGEVDTVYFYAAGTEHFYVPQLMQSDEIKFLFPPNTGVPNNIFFNTEKPVVNQKEFREAISYAINYDEIQKVFTAGYGEIPNAGFVPKGSWGYIETRKLELDLEKADSMLDDLNYKDLNGDGMRQLPDGSPLEVELLLRSDMSESVRLGEMLAAQLKEAGIKLELKIVDNTQFRTISDQEKNHVSFISRTTAWGMMMWGGWGSGYFDGRNIGWSQVNDSHFYDIVDGILATTDENQLTSLAAELQKYYEDELPAIPLYWNVLIQPYNQKWDGWVVDPMYGILNAKTWLNLRYEGGGSY